MPIIVKVVFSSMIIAEFLSLSFRWELPVIHFRQCHLYCDCRWKKHCIIRVSLAEWRRVHQSAMWWVLVHSYVDSNHPAVVLLIHICTRACCFSALLSWQHSSDITAAVLHRNQTCLVGVTQWKNVGLFPSPALDLQLMGNHLYG